MRAKGEPLGTRDHAGDDAADGGTLVRITRDAGRADGVFNTDPDYAESYGHELRTGAAFTQHEYTAKQPGERAFLHAAAYEPSPEVPTTDYPLLLTTGRTVYQFHTRTKTGCAPQFDETAPDVWVGTDDATSLSVREATGCAWNRRAARSRAVSGSAAFARGSCSSPSTTGRGTATTTAPC
jgi:anaerobic selenocysteine-containing dehydrogenase